jgi:hypothetical protein
VFGVAAVVSLALVASASASWQLTTKVPSSGAVADFTSPAVGLADNGAASILYRDGADMYVASRQSGVAAWTRKQLWPEAGGSRSLVLDMNAAGDAVAAYRLSDGGGFVGVAYKPAGGPWEANAFLDNSAGSSGGQVDVEINSAGTAIVAWGSTKAGSPIKNQVRVALRTKAGSWPALNGYATAVDETADWTGNVYAVPCAGPAAAIDDLGRLFIAYASPYASFNALFDEPVVCGVRTALWNGSTWSAPSNLTPRPPIGYESGSTEAAPDVGTPVASADSASGKLTLAFRFSADGYDQEEEEFFNDQGWSTAVYGGTVAAGVSGGPLETPSIGAIGELAVGAQGTHATLATTAFDGQFEGEFLASGGSGVAGSPFGIGPLMSKDLKLPGAAVGGDGRPFYVFEDPVGANSALAWTGPAGQALCPVRTLLAPTTSSVAVAANGGGDGIAAVGNNTGLYYADFLAAEPGCGPGGGGGGDGGNPPAPPGPPTPPGNAITVKAPKSLSDGKVELAITFPGAGKVALKGTAKVDSSDLARAATTKTIVVTQKNATVKGAGKVIFKLAPNSSAKKVVKKKGKLSAKLAIVFTPSGGSARTETRTIVFKAPKRSGK